MRRYLVRLFLIASVMVAARSQNLGVATNLDASQWPLLHANIFAVDAAGNQARPSASEIRVSENGSSRAVISVSCPAPVPLKRISSVLMMDVSGSMAADLGGTTKISLA